MEITPQSVKTVVEQHSTKLEQKDQVRDIVTISYVIIYWAKFSSKENREEKFGLSLQDI